MTEMTTSTLEAADADARDGFGTDEADTAVTRCPAGTTWLGIKLVDEQDEAIAGEPFVVIDGRGEVITRGTTGRDGLAGADNLVPGRYEVCFPELDASVWALAATAGSR